MATFTFRRGATFTIALEAVLGDPTGCTITSSVKQAINRAAPGDSAPDLVDFACTAVPHVNPADTTTGPGWQLTLTEDQTADLAAGAYVTDGRIVLSDGVTVVQTETLFLTVQERVTEPV
jgi:hypothetical protein